MTDRHRRQLLVLLIVVAVASTTWLQLLGLDKGPATGLGAAFAFVVGIIVPAAWRG